MVGRAAASPGAAPPLQVGGLIEKVEGSKFFDSGRGFAWGRTGNSFVVLRSSDNGSHWSALRLDALGLELSALAIGPNGQPGSVFVHFADPSHGWIAWSTDAPDLRIASTSDGGESWRLAATLPTDTIVEDELSPGPGRDCLLAQMPEGMMHTTMAVISTDDNGLTWTESELPHGDGVTGWSFRTATDGFIAVQYPSGISILLYRTADGGKSWDPVDIPLPAGTLADDVMGTFPGTPAFSGPQGLDGSMRVGLSLPNGLVNYLYRTTDGGKSWQAADKGSPAK